MTATVCGLPHIHAGAGWAALKGLRPALGPRGHSVVDLNPDTELRHRPPSPLPEPGNRVRTRRADTFRSRLVGATGTETVSATVSRNEGTLQSPRFQSREPLGSGGCAGGRLPRGPRGHQAHSRQCCCFQPGSNWAERNRDRASSGPTRSVQRVWGGRAAGWGRAEDAASRRRGGPSLLWPPAQLSHGESFQMSLGVPKTAQLLGGVRNRGAFCARPHRTG